MVKPTVIEKLTIKHSNDLDRIRCTIKKDGIEFSGFFVNRVKHINCVLIFLFFQFLCFAVAWQHSITSWSLQIVDKIVIKIWKKFWNFGTKNIYKTNYHRVERKCIIKYFDWFTRKPLGFKFMPQIKKCIYWKVLLGYSIYKSKVLVDIFYVFFMTRFEFWRVFFLT